MLFVLALGVLVLALTGCGPFVDPYNLQDRADQPAAALGAGTTAGQTFVAHCNGLADVDLQVAVYPDVARTSGLLSVSLWELSPRSGDLGTAVPSPGRSPLATERFAEVSLQPNHWLRFSIPPIRQSSGKEFLVRVETTDSGKSPATIWATSHLTSMDSHRFVGDETVPGTWVYRTYCDQSAVDVAGETVATVGRSGWLWPLALLVCVLPGLGIVSLIDNRERDPAAALGLGIGWSVLLAPCLLVLGTPLRLGPILGLASIVVGPGLLIWRRPRWRFSSWSVVAMLSTTVALAIRAIDARGLVAPMWGDPVQHSYVADLILQSGGVPTTYGQLVPPQVFDYHFGFQTLAAFASWIAHANTVESVLATGQILDALICLALYRFARDLAGSPRAGAVAAVLAGLVTTQPTYFVTWGRYPELAGLVALPAAFAALRLAVASPPRPLPTGNGEAERWPDRTNPTDRQSVASLPSWERVRVRVWAARIRALAPDLHPCSHLLIAALAAAAMVLVHPRIAVFLACLGIGLVVVDSLRWFRSVFAKRMTSDPVAWGTSPRGWRCLARPGFPSPPIPSPRRGRGVLREAASAKTLPPVAGAGDEGIQPSRDEKAIHSRAGSPVLARRSTWPPSDWRRRAGRSSAFRLAIVGLASLLLVVPWIARLWAAHHQQVVSTWTWQPIDFPLDLATAGNDRWVLIVALVGLVAALRWRPALAVLLTTWWVLALVIANPATFHLPVNLFLNGSSLAIALFVPATILVGVLFDLLAESLHQNGWPVFWRWLSAGLLLVVGLTQAPRLTTVVNPCCLLIRPGDVGAIEWVRAHTPPDARFVINGYRWMDQIWMGTDAGYWLPVLAHRPTSLPPLFYAVGPTDQVQRIDQTAASVEGHAKDPAVLAQLADQIGARYVFIGARGGPLDPALLERSGLFRVDYQGGGAWVFEVEDNQGKSASKRAGAAPPHESESGYLP